MTISRNLSFLAEGVSSTGVLGASNGGTGLTSLTASYIPYGNGTSAFGSSSTLTYNGTSLSAGNFVPSSSSIPSNGIYLPSTNSLGFSTNSTLAATIFSSGGVSIGNTTDPGATNLSVQGKVGIGNAAPATTLDVTGTIRATGNVSPSSGSGLESIFAGGASYLVSYNRTTPAFLPLQLQGSNIYLQPNGATALLAFASGGVSIGNTTDPGATNLSVTGTIASTTTVKTGGYTVATLPTGVTGARAYVTNALTPTFGATVVGGGAVIIPVFYNGTNWIVG